ncbi:hypothetical protein ABPG75_003141 [Micractinium tetrahymenae]
MYFCRQAWTQLRPGSSESPCSAHLPVHLPSAWHPLGNRSMALFTSLAGASALAASTVFFRLNPFSMHSALPFFACCNCCPARAWLAHGGRQRQQAWCQQVHESCWWDVGMKLFLHSAVSFEPGGK